MAPTLLNLQIPILLLFIFWKAQITDIFFIVFHTFLIFFNLFGWIFKSLRKANLVVLLLTGASWFILGIFYGIGFCPFTEWHWNLLHKLGQYNLPDSYISYLIERFTGYRPDLNLVDTFTIILYFMALAISVYLNFFRKKK
jgi:ABC-type multidrug transport system permease subunit